MDDFPRLIRAAQRGDAAARDAVLAAALPPLQAFVRINAKGLVLSREWSVDLAQSVCVDALRALDGFSGGSEEQFKSWLYKIALNKIRMRHRFLTAQRRDARRDRSLDADDDGEGLAAIHATASTPSADVSSQESIGRIEAAMDELSAEQRLTLTMATVLGLSHKEISEHLGKTEPAVRKALSRARARLSLLLAMEDTGDR